MSCSMYNPYRIILKIVVKLKWLIPGFEFMYKFELIEVCYISVIEFNIVLKFQEAYPSFYNILAFEIPSNLHCFFI
jgi:hypothetical protein